MSDQNDGRFHVLELAGNRVVLDAEIGHLRGLEFAAEGGSIAPLHTAPWVDDAPISRDTALAPTEQGLSGDFLCAPFCANDVEPGPLHGPAANAPWRVEDTAQTTTNAVQRSVLTVPVMGATIHKSLSFRAGEPFLYISHRFVGGTGRLPISHHAMIRVETRARLSYSPKALYFTGLGAPEPDPARGRSLLRYPHRGEDLGAVPLSAGGTVDIRTYPFAEGHEDIVAMAEAVGSTFGWSAAVRETEDDIVLLLKDARTLPQTMLWMSNGGRDYHPWNGRHRHVLGIEDGRSFNGGGHRASIEPNLLTERGYPTALDLAGNPEIPYAIGAIRRPAGWTEVADITAGSKTLTLTDVSGDSLTLPFATAHLFPHGIEG